MERRLLVRAERPFRARVQALLRQRRNARLRVVLHRAKRDRAVCGKSAVEVEQLALQQLSDRELRARAPLLVRVLADAAFVGSLCLRELLLLLQHPRNRVHGLGIALIERIGALKCDEPLRRDGELSWALRHLLHRESPLRIDDRALHAFPVCVRWMLRQVVAPCRKRWIHVALAEQHVARQSTRERGLRQRVHVVLLQKGCKRTQRVVRARRAHVATRDQVVDDPRLLVLRPTCAQVAQCLHGAVDLLRCVVGHAERQRDRVGRVASLGRILAEREQVAQHAPRLLVVAALAQRLTEQQHRLALARVDREFGSERHESLRRVRHVARSVLRGSRAQPHRVCGVGAQAEVQREIAELHHARELLGLLLLRLVCQLQVDLRDLFLAQEPRQPLRLAAMDLRRCAQIAAAFFDLGAQVSSLRQQRRRGLLLLEPRDRLLRRVAIAREPLRVGEQQQDSIVGLWLLLLQRLLQRLRRLGIAALDQQVLPFLLRAEECSGSE